MPAERLADQIDLISAPLQRPDLLEAHDVGMLLPKCLDDRPEAALVLAEAMADVPRSESDDHAVDRRAWISSAGSVEGCSRRPP